ncbi:MAG: undecaprenyldiphospho-muramoylpentapeptide beta-N-acetylglucosaminyltransferase [Bacteroidales bacterium]|nr:undecaprenyldiphospho-muramoylpentapeptide beta-N-acetylglucosaminyltransferase [Bacteroidales bacterium]
MQKRKYKIIISGGGTGGHIFPAIAIAQALQKKIDKLEILFIGAKGRMEMEKVPKAGYSIKGLWISGLQRKLTIKNFLFPVKLLSSIYNTKKIIKEFKPDVVIGVGGYASGPTLWVASRQNIPTAIQEQNSFPGITNKLLAKSVDKIFVAYKNMEKFFPVEKIIFSGNPIREEIIITKGKKEEALKYFNLSGNKKTILVVGGSQGAKAINESIDSKINQFSDNNLQLIWQTGKFYFEKAKLSASEKEGIKVIEFITKMDYAYSCADIVISRAGAIAISELCAVGKPTVFVPLPTAAENHQYKNALALRSQDAALIVKNDKAKEKLVETVIELSKNEEKQQELTNNIRKLAIIKADDQIADEIIKLIK